MKKSNKLFSKLDKFKLKNEKLKKIYGLYEHIITNPILITILVFIIVLTIIVSITLMHGYYGDRFRENLLVEAHGVVFDIFILGVVVLWLQQKGKNKMDKKRYQNEIDDFRGWKSEEAARRIRGNIRRLNSFGLTKIDINNCYLRNMDLRNTDLSGSYGWGADLSWTDLRFSKFSNGNYEYADFSYSNLSESNLNEGHFFRTNFENSDMRNVSINNSLLVEASFADSDLSGSDLSSSIFKNSNMKNTILVGSDLSGANLGSAEIENINFQDCDLRGVKGLGERDFLKVFSLYNTRLDKNIEEFIKKEKPELLEETDREENLDF